MIEKITYKKVNVPQMTIESTKGKIPLYVSQVMKSSSLEENGNKTMYYKIDFKKAEHPGYIIATDDDIKFLHYCDANANGSSCSHLVLAIGIADLLGFSISKVGFPKKPISIDLDTESFECISEDVGVLPPVKTTPAPVAASTAPSTPAPATSSPSTTRNWMNGWNEVQDYLQEQGLSTRAILDVREKRQALYDTVVMTDMGTEPVKPSFPYMGDMMSRAVRHILMGKDLLFVGDKGSGKDTLVSTLAWIFGLPLYLQTGNADETKESIVGENTIVQGTKGMEVVFKKTAFAVSVENGGLSHYAELNMLPGDVTSIFHSVLDDNRQLSTQNGSISRHEGHIFIGSINQGDQYSGVKKLNGAFKDRLSILKLPYVQDFREMLIRKTSLSDNHALDFLVKTKTALDELIITEQQGEESKTIRGYIDAAEVRP